MRKHCHRPSTECGSLCESNFIPTLLREKKMNKKNKDVYDNVCKRFVKSPPQVVFLISKK